MIRCFCRRPVELPADDTHFSYRGKNTGNVRSSEETFMLTWLVLFLRVGVKVHLVVHPRVGKRIVGTTSFFQRTNQQTSSWGPVTTTTRCWIKENCSLPVTGDPQVPSMVLMVELSSASISFSKSSPLDDSLSPVRYSLISFFFCSRVPFSSTSSSSSELNHSKSLQRSKTPTRK